MLSYLSLIFLLFRLTRLQLASQPEGRSVQLRDGLLVLIETNLALLHLNIRIQVVLAQFSFRLRHL